jgi:hypothetical protein
MAEFGLRTLVATGDNSTTSAAGSFGFSAAGTSNQPATTQRFHTAGAGETITGVGVNAKNNGASAANFAMAVYEYVPSGDVAVFGTLGARVAYEVSPATIPNDDTFREHLVTLTTPLLMDESTTYMVCMSTDLTNAIIVINGPERAQAASALRDFDGVLYGGLGEPWDTAGSTAQALDLAMFAEYTIAAAGAPTFTPYTTIVLDKSATGSIDLSTNWTGASTFNITNMPNWMTQVGDTGVVNYADTSWGGQYSENSIGGGKWFMEIEAIDTTGLLTASTGIWVYIRP